MGLMLVLYCTFIIHNGMGLMLVLYCTFIIPNVTMVVMPLLLLSVLGILLLLFVLKCGFLMVWA